MTPKERLVVDYAGTSVTTGSHPMYFRRQELKKQRYLTASELRKRSDGEFVKSTGLAIVKQRPGTAKGFVFMSVSDETDANMRSMRVTGTSMTRSRTPPHSPRNPA
jgi:error-prone DNA polymerase